MANILNQQTLDSLLELGDDFFRELIQTFLDCSQTQIDTLREAIGSGDGKGIESAAHSLKGACYGQGTEELGELCKEMETKGRENDLADVSILMKEIEESHIRTRAALKELL